MASCLYPMAWMTWIGTIDDTTNLFYGRRWRTTSCDDYNDDLGHADSSQPQTYRAGLICHIIKDTMNLWSTAISDLFLHYQWIMLVESIEIQDCHIMRLYQCHWPLSKDCTRSIYKKSDWINLIVLRKMYCLFWRGWVWIFRLVPTEHWSILKYTCIISDFGITSAMYSCRMSVY